MRTAPSAGPRAPSGGVAAAPCAAYRARAGVPAARADHDPPETEPVAIARVYPRRPWFKKGIRRAHDL
jgi:hypothetical protein